MADICSQEDGVMSMGAIGGREEGRGAVSESMEGVAAACTDGTVTRTDNLVRVTGDLTYELCNESVSMTFAREPISMECRAVDVYWTENGEWKIVHHHIDSDAESVEKMEAMGA